MKLDLEGAEYEALKGFEESLRNKNIRVVQFEYGYMSISTKKLLIDYYELFYSYGYIVGKIFPKKVEFRDYNLKHENFIGSNYIAIAREDRELITCLKNC